MSKKAIISLSIVLGIVAVVLILFWTLFALSTVTVDYKTATLNLNLTDEEIKQYLSLNEWQGKAGAYAIQGEGKRLVETIDGDLETVIGLPVNKLIKYLKDNEIKKLTCNI